MNPLVAGFMVTGRACWQPKKVGKHRNISSSTA
jgi:hypothetical protein